MITFTQCLLALHLGGLFLHYLINCINTNIQFHKEDPQVIENYRQIRLTYTIGKSFQGIIADLLSLVA